MADALDTLLLGNPPKDTENHREYTRYRRGLLRAKALLDPQTADDQKAKKKAQNQKARAKAKGQNQTPVLPEPPKSQGGFSEVAVTPEVFAEVWAKDTDRAKARASEVRSINKRMMAGGSDR